MANLRRVVIGYIRQFVLSDSRRCSSHPKDFVVTLVWCFFSCFRLVMPNKDFVAIPNPFWFV